MYLSNQLKGILIFMISFFLFACGSNNKSEETTSQTEVKKSNKVVASKCDRILEDYDKIVTKAIQITKDRIDGKEVDKAEEEKLQKEAEEVSKRILKMGYAGLGGQHCYTEFVNIQMKWSQMAMEVQQKAIEEAMKNVDQ